MQALLFCVLLDWRIGLSLIAMHLDDPNFSTLDLPQRLEERLRMESKRPEVRMDSTKSVDPIVKSFSECVERNTFMMQMFQAALKAEAVIHAVYEHLG